MTERIRADILRYLDIEENILQFYNFYNKHKNYRTDRMLRKKTGEDA